MFQNLNIWGVFWTNQVQTEQNEVGRWRVGGGLAGIKSLVNARALKLECANLA